MKREDISSLVDRMIANIHYSTINLIGSTGDNILVQHYIGSLCFIPNPGTSESYRAVIVEHSNNKFIYHEITEYDEGKEYIRIKSYANEEGLEIYKKPPFTLIESNIDNKDSFGYQYNIGHRSPEDDDKRFVVGSVLSGADYMFAILKKINAAK